MKTLKRLIASIALVLVTLAFQNCGIYSTIKSNAVELFSFLKLDSETSSSQVTSISRFEFLSSAQTLTGDTTNLTLADLSSLPADAKINAFESAAVQSYDESFLNARMDFAQKVAQVALRSFQVVFCQPAMTQHPPWAGCVRDITVRFASRAFRREITAAEEATLQQLYESAANSADSELVTAPFVNPIGYLDHAGSDLMVYGWSLDPAWSERTVEIHFYVDDQFAGQTFANNPRPDVTEYFAAEGYKGDHGYRFILPARYADGVPHTVTAYAIGAGGANPAVGSKLFTATSVAKPIVNLPQLGASGEEGLRAVFSKILLSPQFQLRRLSVPADLASGQAVNYQIANQLAWFITGTLPDDGLMEKARLGQLTNPGVRRSEASRLIAANSERFSLNVFGQWMGFRDLALRPGVTSLEQAMVRESTLVFKEIIDQNLPPQSMLEPGFTFVNSTLASHYGIPRVVGDFIKVPHTERGGILRQGSILRMTSPNTETKPIVRGKWVQWALLCRTIPSPSADLFQQIAMAQAQADPNWSVSERLAHHRASGAACTKCHQYMDPLGLALENYGPMGLWRDSYANGRPVIADAQLEDQKFSGVAALNSLIRNRSDFNVCVASRLLTHGLARALAEKDIHLMYRLMSTSSGIRDMIQKIAESEEFVVAAKGAQ